VSASKRNYVVALLLEIPPTAADLAECFPHLTAAEDGVSLAGYLDDEKTAYLVVDAWDHSWPDNANGKNLSTAELELGTERGGLQRSLDQCWVWDTVAEVVGRHQAVIRVRLEISGSVPLTPSAASKNLVRVIRETISGRGLPNVLAYFQPAGEVLLPPHVVAEILEHATIAQIPPLDLWSNIRISWLTDHWSLVETVGNIQLDLPDAEIYFEHARQEANDVAALARAVSLRMLTEASAPSIGQSFAAHDGSMFIVVKPTENLLPPARPITRLLPEVAGDLPEDLAKRLGLA